MQEAIVVTTYKRPELLCCCLDRIVKYAPDADIFVFPDRGTWSELGGRIIDRSKGSRNFNFCWVPPHGYYGNSFNTMEALRTVYNAGAERVYYIEDDVMVHEDFFDWHREQQELFPRIFASMAWVFNRNAPIINDRLFQPWYYAIGTCFSRQKLEVIVQHATPFYYEDMPGYIERNFPASHINSPFGIAHFEQDGLIQRVLDQDKTQTISSGIAKCSHLGCYGYNRGWSPRDEFFDGCKNFYERVDRVKELMADPYWRVELFGREIVEREVGHELPKREFHYQVTLPGGWKSYFMSELEQKVRPRRANSVLLPPEAEIVLS